MKKHTNVFMPWYFFIKYVKWPLETLVSEVVCPTNLIASIVNRESLWGYYLCENLSFLTQEQQFVFLGTMLYSMLLSIWYFTWEASFIFFSISFLYKKQTGMNAHVPPINPWRANHNTYTHVHVISAVNIDAISIINLRSIKIFFLFFFSAQWDCLK